MKYIIMADGRGTRWNNYGGIPKYLLKVDGEVILERTIRLIRELGIEDEIIITSHDPRCEFTGARRYVPLNNNLEIDRFTYELIEDSVCFLYGDTYYTEEAMKIIVDTPVEELIFFGSRKKIFALKIGRAQIMKEHIQRIKDLYLKGSIKECIGWEIYQSYMGLPFQERRITDKYILIEDRTCDFNEPKDYKGFSSVDPVLHDNEKQGY